MFAEVTAWNFTRLGDVKTKGQAWLEEQQVDLIVLCQVEKKMKKVREVSVSHSEILTAARLSLIHFIFQISFSEPSVCAGQVRDF